MVHAYSSICLYTSNIGIQESAIKARDSKFACPHIQHAYIHDDVTYYAHC